MPEIESKNRRTREKVRALTSDLVYRWIPTLLLIHMVYFAVLWLNAFPVAGESWGISPRTAVTRRELNWNRDCKACLGSYVEASVDPDITNTNEKYKCTTTWKALNLIDMILFHNYFTYVSIWAQNERPGPDRT